MAEPVDPMLAYHLNFGGGTAPQPLDFDAMRQHLLQRTTGPAVQNMHYHVNPLAAPQAYINNDALEPVAFGSLADPVSQLAFLGAPSLLRGSKAMLDAAAQPGPSMRGVLASERGNLGPPPVGPRGDPLPQSVLRNEAGELERYYHGTPSAYPDFVMSHMDPHGLYGPGVYTTNSADVAGGSVAETARGYMGYASKGYAPESADLFAAHRRTLQGQVENLTDDLQRFRQEMAQPGASPGLQANQRMRLERKQVALARAQEELSGVERDFAVESHQGPHIRPVYPDLQRPFDIAGQVDVPQLNAAVAQLPPQQAASIVEGIRAYLNQSGQRLTNSSLYEGLVHAFNGDKAQVNALLQQWGYDGITHTGGAILGGQPHKVAIAFSPDQVYPSFGVDALRQSQASPLAGYGPQASPLGGTP